jgi:hypothetical protein
MGGGKTPPTTQAQLSDFFRLAALASNDPPLLARHLRFEAPDDAGASDHARKRQGDAKVFIVTSDRHDRSLIAKHHFRDACRHDANAKLAGVIAFDDGDIGVANAVFDLLAHPVKRLAARLDELADRHAGDTRGRPKKYVRHAMSAITCAST